MGQAHGVDELDGLCSHTHLSRFPFLQCTWTGHDWQSEWAYVNAKPGCDKPYRVHSCCLRVWNHCVRKSVLCY